MEQWIKQLSGRFVVFDGPDGSGKTTQLQRVAAMARSNGLAVCEVREPGGTEVGERIRAILLDPVFDEMTLRCEMLLYMASRAQLVEQLILPALNDGQFVLADRFLSATIAYQGAGGGLGMDTIATVGKVAVGDGWPDLTLIFDVDQKTAHERMSSSLDRIEQRDKAYHQRVRNGFLEQASQDPSRCVVIDARNDLATVSNNVDNALEHWLSHATVR
ncbi:MAG: dTMP kinase [Phycisphaerales bacterium]|nr:dTMP kinase [Phycisphaerales bacterium]